jgi:hypothetical protein
MRISKTQWIKVKALAYKAQEMGSLNHRTGADFHTLLCLSSDVLEAAGETDDPITHKRKELEERIAFNQSWADLAREQLAELNSRSDT